LFQLGIAATSRAPYLLSIDSRIVLEWGAEARISIGMYGPKPLGHWTASMGQREFQHLRVGGMYTVSGQFKDFDGDTHPVGETWQFLGHSFLPYEDGLSLFVSPDGTSEWHIRLQWRPEGQGEVVDNLSRYIKPAPASR
jgi:hypothetical protein